jgi:transcriptional regulator
MLAFMRANSFATLVSVVDGAPFATHLPLLVEERGDEFVILGHVARPNAQWKSFDAAESLVIFGGPHAYISPSLYEKEESVPTWNYIAIHTYGTPAIFNYADAPERVQSMLEMLMEALEPAYLQQWESLTEKYRVGMMMGIVAFEIVVTRLEGKYKLSQNRPLVDQETVAEHLLQSSDMTISAVGAAMQERIRQEG